MALIRTLGSVHKAMRARLTPLLAERFGIDLGLFILLRQIEDGAAHPGDLARESMEPPSQISRRLDKLQRLNLVHRTLDPEDSRRIRLALTPEGRAVVETVDASAVEALGPALAAIPAEVRRTVMEGLQALAGALAPGPTR